MAKFPAIRPTLRLYAPGVVSSVSYTSLNGRTFGFRRGDRRIGQTLDLLFSHLTEAEMLRIKNHYKDSNGTFEIFFLSAEIWADHTNPPVPLISEFAWRYASQPIVEDVSYDKFTVSVKLVTEPIETGDVVVDGGPADPLDPVRINIMDGLSAAATPARELIISAGGAA